MVLWRDIGMAGGLKTKFRVHASLFRAFKKIVHFKFHIKLPSIADFRIN